MSIAAAVTAPAPVASRSMKANRIIKWLKANAIYTYSWNWCSPGYKKNEPKKEEANTHTEKPKRAKFVYYSFLLRFELLNSLSLFVSQHLFCLSSLQWFGQIFYAFVPSASASKSCIQVLKIVILHKNVKPAIDRRHWSISIQLALSKCSYDLFCKIVFAKMM